MIGFKPRVFSEACFFRTSLFFSVIYDAPLSCGEYRHAAVRGDTVNRSLVLLGLRGRISSASV